MTGLNASLFPSMRRIPFVLLLCLVAGFTHNAWCAVNEERLTAATLVQASNQLSPSLEDILTTSLESYLIIKSSFRQPTLRERGVPEQLNPLLQKTLQEHYDDYVTLCFYKSDQSEKEYNAYFGASVSHPLIMPIILNTIHACPATQVCILDAGGGCGFVLRALLEGPKPPSFFLYYR